MDKIQVADGVLDQIYNLTIEADMLDKVVKNNLAYDTIENRNKNYLMFYTYGSVTSENQVSAYIYIMTVKKKNKPSKSMKNY